MQNVNIAGIDKAKVLAALYNCADVPRRESAAKVLHGPYVMEETWAQTLIDTNGPLFSRKKNLFFEEVHGRRLWVGIGYTGIHPAAYDHYNGHGVAAKAIQHLRETGDCRCLSTEQVDVWMEEVINESLRRFGHDSTHGDMYGATLYFLTGMARNEASAWLALDESTRPTLALAFEQGREAGREAMYNLVEQERVDPVA